ncbi:MAG: TonB family protein [Brasilonema angustatum HA4187-MV1]|jgi:TonB family protein|nr:TonB family protein [Brasilonema angustatum HA4187-MV1]
MAKSHASQRNKSDGAKHHALKGDRPENRPENLIFYVVTSILLHSVLLIASDYWLRAVAPKQEVSEPIPIEFVQVPPNQTKTPPETSQRAAKNSVAGGKPKPGKPISAAKSGSTTAPETKSGSESSELLLPERTQQKTVSSNPSPQKLQAKPQKIASAPVTKPLAPEPKRTAVAPVTKLAEPSPTAVTQKPKPPEPESSPTAVAPITKPPKPESSPTAVAPKPQPPEPEPSPTAVAPTTNPLALKLRQRTIPPQTTPPEPEPLPTAVEPKPKPLALKPRQTVVTPTIPPEPEPSPTAVAPTTKPLALKLRQRRVTPKPQPPEPEPLPTAVAPKPKPLALKPRQTVVTPKPQLPETEPYPTTVAPTTKPLALKPRQTLVSPDTTPSEPSPFSTTVTPKPKPLALKPRQTVVSPDTTPSVPSTRRENSSRLAAKSSPEQFQNRANSLLSPGTPRRASSRSQNQSTTSPRKLSRSQASSKSGGASRLGGPLSVSSGDYRTNNLAALPNSNRLNQGTQGIDASKDADMGAYLQQLQEQVKRNWIPGLTQSSQRTVLQFTVSRSGLVSDLHVAQSSGFGMTDEAALNAINRAVPFAPFPTEYPQNYINIQFTFNINVYGQLELWSDQ